jgi:hypothetical protein
MEITMTKINLTDFQLTSRDRYISALESVRASLSIKGIPGHHLLDIPAHHETSRYILHRSGLIGGALYTEESKAWFEGLFNASDIRGAGGVLQIVRCGLACRLMTVPHLYCWESLVPLYTKRGWRTVETYPFDPAQAPEGWTGGEQACHVMRWPDAGKYARTSEAYRYGLGLIK